MDKQRNLHLSYIKIEVFAIYILMIYFIGEFFRGKTMFLFPFLFVSYWNFISNEVGLKCFMNGNKIGFMLIRVGEKFLIQRDFVGISSPEFQSTQVGFLAAVKYAKSSCHLNLVGKKKSYKLTQEGRSIIYKKTLFSRLV